MEFTADGFYNSQQPPTNATGCKVFTPGPLTTATTPRNVHKPATTPLGAGPIRGSRRINPARQAGGPAAIGQCAFPAPPQYRAAALNQQ